MSVAPQQRDLPASTSVPANLFVIWSAKSEVEQWGDASCDIRGSTTDTLIKLAEALAASSLGREMPGATLIARPAPEPALGVLGHFDAAAEARLKARTAELNHTLPRVKYVSYAQVEEDCERLGMQLVERFGRDELRRFKFTAIPRGGFIVLGILAYVLGLEQAQLETPDTTDKPLVIVDDCALTGSRFARFVNRFQNRHLVFSHLYSHPNLREAIEGREKQVVCCVGARDLHDYAPELFGATHARWREHWMSHAGGPRYWIGNTEHLCFPWSEPDRAVWNPVAEQVERGWPVVPPDLCVKNRTTHDGLVPIQVQPEGQGPLRPSSRVLFGEYEERVVVGDMAGESSVSLTGVAADMWRAIVQHGNLEDAVASLAREYDIDSATLRVDLQGFVEALIDRGLLEEDYEPVSER